MASQKQGIFPRNLSDIEQQEFSFRSRKYQQFMAAIPRMISCQEHLMKDQPLPAHQQITLEEFAIIREMVALKPYFDAAKQQINRNPQLKDWYEKITVSEQFLKCLEKKYQLVCQLNPQKTQQNAVLFAGKKRQIQAVSEFFSALMAIGIIRKDCVTMPLESIRQPLPKK